MSDATNTDLLREPAAAAAAVQAWRRLGAGAEPRAVTLLCARPKGAAVRLEGAGEHGSDVIAKYSPDRIASVERIVYEQVLARAGLDDLRYYGHEGDGSAGGWIFLEDARGERWVRTDAEHHVLAGRWAARLHAGAAAAAAAAGLPDLSLPAHRERVQRIRTEIRAAHDNPALAAADFEVLDGIEAQLDRLEGAWARIEAACRGVPPTLVHGDLRPKNSRVRRGAGGPSFVVFDWETAGFGVPAADLARVDTVAYAQVLGATWPQVDLAACRALARVGRVFRNLDAIRWETCGLVGAWQQNRILRLSIYRDRLAAVLAALFAAGKDPA